MKERFERKFYVGKEDNFKLKKLYLVYKIKELFDRGFKPIPYYKRYTPLHLAATECIPELVDLLLEDKPNVLEQDFLGKIPLHYAVE